MKLETVQSVVALGLALHLGVATVLAGSPAIGTIVTKGSFRLDNATVKGNATLFEGATVETSQAESSMELTTGTRLLLATASKGKIYGDHLLLEKGEGQLENGAGFRLEALGLTIRPDTSTSSARVVLNGADHVQVSANRGSFRVLNSQGVLVANITSGTALDLSPLKNSSTSRITGTPRSQNGRFVLTDETTKVTMELNGQGVEKELGQRIEVTGSMDTSGRPATEASQVMRVTQIARLFNKDDANDSNNTKSKKKAAAAGDSDSSSSGSAAGKGNGSAAPAGVGGAAAGATAGVILGLSTTTVAIVGGVAAASTLGGLAAANKLPGQSSTATSSR